MLCPETKELFDPEAGSIPKIGHIDWNYLTGYGVGAGQQEQRRGQRGAARAEESKTRAEPMGHSPAAAAASPSCHPPCYTHERSALQPAGG